ncbi:DUF6766 family protein [Arthrobacter sp. NPDC092385]|uniref:DUF6766 family protein n=1 Tax=Arthrobacter sp. NPDC092385 TaxID=3363943 RepID=UPI0037FBFD41
MKHWIRDHGLLLANLLLFLVSFLGMVQAGHGQPGVSIAGYMGTSRFWFESFQNWQSEFMVIAVMVGASVYRRERGSVESKPVAMAHSDTDT